MVSRKRVESWAVSDEFWRRVESLIPVRAHSTDKSSVMAGFPTSLIK